jgi:hypothetical protein
MEQLLSSNSGPAKSMEQAVPKTSGQRYYNIIAKLTSWGKDGVATVEPLTDLNGVALPESMSVKVAEDRKRLQLIDFEFRRKQGLRVGGAVLLRKAIVEDDLIVCKEVDIMRGREKEGPCIVKRNAAAFIHPPEIPNSRIPKNVTIAALSDAKRVKSLSECITTGLKLVEDARLFGVPSLILTEANSLGDVEEIPISFDDLSEDAISSRIAQSVDVESQKMMQASKKGWWLVPAFTTELEPYAHKTGKIAAQLANHDYGDLQEPLWTRTNAVLRGDFAEFFITDVSPICEPQDNSPALLLDLLPE